MLIVSRLIGYISHSVTAESRLLESDRTKAILLKVMIPMQIDSLSMLDCFWSVFAEEITNSKLPDPTLLQVFIISLMRYIQLSQQSDSAEPLKWHQLPYHLQAGNSNGYLEISSARRISIQTGLSYEADTVFTSIHAAVAILVEHYQRDILMESLLGSADDMKSYLIKGRLLSTLNRDFEASLSDLQLVRQRCEKRKKILLDSEKLAAENANELWLVFSHYFDEFVAKDIPHRCGYGLLEQVRQPVLCRFI